MHSASLLALHGGKVALVSVKNNAKIWQGHHCAGQRLASSVEGNDNCNNGEAANAAKA